MIIEGKKLFFRTVSVVLDDGKVLELLKSKRYSSIVVLSYNKLDLPGFTTYSKPTLLIDLTESKDDILHGFNDTTRNEIRKSGKIDSLKIDECEQVSESSYQLYKAFEYSQGRIPVSFTSLSQAVFFGAEYKGELISGIYLLKSAPYLRIRSIFSKRLDAGDRDHYRIIGYATRRIIWEACLWGKNNNYISLDMASVNVNNPKTESIARFKMSFGKELTPEYTYIYKTKLFTFLENLVAIKLFGKRVLYLLRKLIS